MYWIHRDNDGDDKQSQRHKKIFERRSVFYMVICLVGIGTTSLLLFISVWSFSAPSIISSTGPNSTSSFVSDPRRQMFQKLRSTSSQHFDANKSGTNRLFGVCSHIPTGASTSNLWRKYSTDILRASIHPSDVHGAHRNWTQALLTLMSPNLLQGAIRSIPHRETWTNLLLTISRHYEQSQHLHWQEGRTPPPAINVVVFGGSVAYGSYCEKLPSEVWPLVANKTLVPKTIKGPSCSWPIRLQYLLDAMLGPGIVTIHNLAVGGTNTESALPRIEYRLYTSGLDSEDWLVKHGPDVIVNAYAVNDNAGTSSYGPLPWNANKHVIQQFADACMGSRPCQRSAANRPLMVFMNDYVGNFADFLLQEHLRHEVLQEDAWYHGNIGYISAAHMLWHSLVLPNTKETLLSPPWNFKKPEPHFFMPGHVARAWMVAYALLEWTVQACQDEERFSLSQPSQNDRRNEPSQLIGRQTRRNDSHDIASNIEASTFSSQILSHATTENDLDSIANWTRRRPASGNVELDLWTPPLKPSNQFHNISTTWQQHVVERDAAEHAMGCIENTPPCTFAFVAAPAGTVRFKNALQDVMDSVTKSNKGWGTEMNMDAGWRLKLGAVAKEPGARWVLRFAALKSPIQVLTIHYVKSYGEKWSNSTVQCTFTVWNTTQHPPPLPPKYSTRWQLQGFHDMQNSISYHFRKDIGRENRSELGDAAELEIELISGTTFKITAIMMCYR